MARRASTVSSAVVATAFSLRVDVVSAEVVAALRDAGVDSILIKGPGLARLLYDDGTVRAYGDSDLLVAPHDFERAQQVLAALEFEQVTGDWPEPWGPSHAHVWQRSRDGAAVDLHRTICGFEGAPAEVWPALAQHSQSISLCETSVKTPSPAGAALVVAAHAAAHGPQVRKPVDDLVRAIQQLDLAVWDAAASLAHRCGAVAALGEGLRLVPAGEQVADRLGLPRAGSLDARLRAATAPPESLVMARLATTHGLGDKARLLAHRVIAPRWYMHRWASNHFPRLYTLDVRTAVLTSYFVRPLWVAAHMLPALRAYRQAQGEIEGAIRTGFTSPKRHARDQ